MLQTWFEFFRFLKHYRERAAQAAAAERSHQLAMLDRVTTMVENLVDSQAKQAAEQGAALVEIAKANQAQSVIFSEWMKSFQIATAPTSSVVREEDELIAEQSRLLDELGINPDAAAALPPEFRLALELQRGITSLGADSPA
jgi:hypothetical protein